MKRARNLCSKDESAKEPIAFFLCLVFNDQQEQILKSIATCFKSFHLSSVKGILNKLRFKKKTVFPHEPPFRIWF